MTPPISCDYFRRGPFFVALAAPSSALPKYRQTGLRSIRRTLTLNLVLRRPELHQFPLVHQRMFLLRCLPQRLRRISRPSHRHNFLRLQCQQLQVHRHRQHQPYPHPPWVSKILCTLPRKGNYGWQLVMNCMVWIKKVDAANVSLLIV